MEVRAPILTASHSVTSGFWSRAPSGSKAAISNPTAQIASFVPDLPGTFVVQLIVNDGFLNSLPATAEIAVVSQQTSLVAQIQERQGVIGTLPDDAFKFKGSRALISLELNAVLLSVEKHDYRAALLVLRTVILPQADGCAIAQTRDQLRRMIAAFSRKSSYPRWSLMPVQFARASKEDAGLIALLSWSLMTG